MSLAISGSKGPLSLALDRTNWEFKRININLLVLAVVIMDQFSISLFWKALSKKGNSNAAECIDLLRSFIDLFGVEHIACLMPDREFIGKAWVDFLIHNKIPFFIRIKENRLVEWGDQMCHISDFFHQRIEKLFAVVGAALLLCFMVGRQEKNKSPTPYKKTVKAPVVSTFKLGFDFLRKQLFQIWEHALELLASFLPQPLNTIPGLCP